MLRTLILRIGRCGGDGQLGGFYKAFPAYTCLRSYKEATVRCLKNQFSDDLERDLFEQPLRAAIYSKAIKPLLEDAARVI